MVDWAIITLIASYWHRRAWENPDRYDAPALERAQFLDKLAQRIEPEVSAASSDKYLDLYEKWREEGQTDEAIYEILKDYGTLV